MRRPPALALGLLLALVALGPPLAPPAGAEACVAKVRSNLDVERELRAIEAAHPELVEVRSIGASALGQPLWSVRLTDEASEAPKLDVYLDGGHHGNEYLGTELVMLYLRGLVEGWERGDPATRELLRGHNVLATPLLNPDGNILDTRKNARQVDLNRNYPFQWGGPGSSSFRGSLTYRGPAPASEPEVLANLAFAAEQGLDLWVTMHTGVAELYWPWGYTREPAPDAALFESLEAPFEAATRQRVDAKQAAELYLAAGAADDYGYAVLGVPTFTFEVHEDQSVPAYAFRCLDAMLADQLAGLEWLVERTSRLGASVALEPGSQGLRWEGQALVVGLRNEGWGPAEGLRLELRDAGGATLTERVVDVPPESGVEVRFEGAAGLGASSIAGSYAELRVANAERKSFAAELPAP